MKGFIYGMYIGDNMTPHTSHTYQDCHVFGSCSLKLPRTC